MLNFDRGPLKKDELAWLELEEELFEYVHKSKYHPLERPDVFKENPGLKEIFLMRDPRYIGFTAKFLLGIQLFPIQMAIQEVLWNYSFPMLIASRGFAKSFGMAVAGLIKCVLFPGTQIVIAGSTFRQSKVVFDYMMRVASKAHILNDIFKSKIYYRCGTDMWTYHIGESVVHAIPVGDGSRVRGLRANTIYVDEFGSLPPHVFETAIAGFSIVSKDPIEKAKETYKRDYKIEKGTWTKDDELEYLGIMKGNQIVLAGTVSSKHSHFYDYWKRYKAIIHSRGEVDKLKGIIDDEKLSHGLDWRDYCILRIPHEMAPKTFLDPKMIARAKATMHSAIFNSEFGACFYEDTDGFFKESLIRRATASENRPVVINGIPIWFDPVIKGNPSLKYVYGIDPAATRDNFAIVIIELHPNHSRIVYCWSSNEKDYNKRLKNGLTTEHDYYSFCCRKIRDLMKVFPCVRIGIDSQGGGNTIKNLLMNPDHIQPGEQPIYEIIEEDKEKPTDDLKGLHILQLVQFVSIKWATDANNDLRADLENKDLLFPQFNPVLLGTSIEEDNVRRNSAGDDFDFLFDALEDCLLEVEELKKELVNIVVIQKPTHEKFDMPEQRTHDGQKSNMKKDRYSALLIANSIARVVARASAPPDYQVCGGVIGQIHRKTNPTDKLYDAPCWWNVEAGILKGVRRGIGGL